MRIALMGTRGVPASYSGFETCAEQLGKRLVKRGHEVTVYCRKHYVVHNDAFYEGMRLVKLPTIANKYLDTLVHTSLSSLHALSQRFDIGLYFIAGNSPVAWIPRLVGTQTVLNVDGLDWKREKWPSLAKQYIQLAEYLATILPTTYLTDSEVVQSYYRERFNSTPLYIPYGSDVDLVPAGDTLRRFDLTPGRYILFVGRLVPENYVHHLVEAFRTLDTDLKCVIVGDASYADDYIAALKRKAQGDPRIVFTGFVFGKGYHELGTNAHIFVETSGVGGTHPALIEAMAHGNCVVTHDTPENLETIGDAGFSYDGKLGASALAAQLRLLLDHPEMVREYAHHAKHRAATTYTWTAVTDAYERLFYNLLNQSLPVHLQQIGP